MKRLLIILVLVSLLMLAGCKKQTETPISQAEAYPVDVVEEKAAAAPEDQQAAYPADVAKEETNTEPVNQQAAYPAGDASLPAGTWLVEAYKFGGVSAWAEADAQAVVGKTVEITTDSITFDGAACNGVSATLETFEAASYLDAQYRTSPETLGIEASTLNVINTSCNVDGFATILQLDDTTLVINLQGVFFWLIPAN